MNIAYLTIEELSSGLFKTQILDILDEIIIQDSTIKFDIFIVNRPWLYFKHKKILQFYRKKYNQNNFNFVYIPLLPPLRGSLKYYLYSVGISNYLKFIFKISLQKDYQLIHTRSYWPTIAVLDFNRPLVFDLRSLWVLENISTGEIKLDSLSHYYWKNAEKECISRATVSTCVSKGMVEYVNDIYPYSNTELIPISVNQQNFCFNKLDREKNRQILNWESNLVFVYSGSLGQSGINISAIAMLFEKIIALDANYRLLIITSEPKERIERMMKTCNINEGSFRIIKPKINEIPSWLSSADIGLHALPRQLDSNSRLGTKVVEYWMNGLPIIINRNVGAAAQYIDYFKILGYVVEDNVFDMKLRDTILDLINNRDAISDFAIDAFSSNNIALKYINTYKCALNNYV
jgi:hypothetical protein